MHSGRFGAPQYADGVGGSRDWGRTTAIIFSDIVSSTELLYSLGPERNEGVRRSHLADLRRALRDQGAAR